MTALRPSSPGLLRGGAAAGAGGGGQPPNIVTIDASANRRQALTKKAMLAICVVVTGECWRGGDRGHKAWLLRSDAARHHVLHYRPLLFT